MDNCAIIIDNRPSKELDKIIERHMSFLPGWHMRHISDIPIQNGSDYNRVLLDIGFWDQLVFDKVLIFQHDSMILRDGIDEFMEYDFIGAPIKHIPFPSMNGGLSLRTPKKMVDCLLRHPYGKSRYCGHNEDIYFSNYVQSVGGNIPTKEVAQKFSVETIYGLGSFGYHQIESWLSEDQQNKIKNQYEGKSKYMV